MTDLRPNREERSIAKFWDDEHISKQMLKAHLDPETDAASRKKDFIEKSVHWMTSNLLKEKEMSILDLGCGPGLYTNPLASLGFKVTGVDISKRSILYAKEEAIKNNLSIHYLHENYLHLKLNKKFDLIMMIYCDYGALIEKERKALLKVIREHLKEGRAFLFDVNTFLHYESLKVEQSVKVHEGPSFWREGPSKEKSIHRKYGEGLSLHEVHVEDEEGVTPYYIWDQAFSVESLREELKKEGFTLEEYYSDVTGKAYDDKSKTLAVLARV